MAAGPGTGRRAIPGPVPNNGNRGPNHPHGETRRLWPLGNGKRPKARQFGRTGESNMACMGCSVVKKGLAVAALAAGALYLAFGTSAPSYVRTAFHKVRGHAHDAVPVQFEIDRARQEIARLEKPIQETRQVYFRTQVDAEYLEREVATTRANLEKEKTVLQAMAAGAKTGDTKLTG